MIAFSMTMYYRYENRKRDKAEGRPTERGPSVEDVHTQYDRAAGEYLIRYSRAVEPTWDDADEQDSDTRHDC